MGFDGLPHLDNRQPCLIVVMARSSHERQPGASRMSAMIELRKSLSAAAFPGGAVNSLIRVTAIPPVPPPFSYRT